VQLIAYVGSALLVLAATVVILRLIVRRDYLRRGRLTLFSAASEWLMVLIWVSFSYFYLPADWPAIDVPPALQGVGWLLVALGVAAALYSMAWLGIRRAHGLQVDALIQSGPYRLSRNPQIVGFGLAMIGFLLISPSWHMGVSLALCAFLVQMMVLTEEEHLLSRYGDEYRAYCRRTPRYLWK
jgi:protein-S-isoprenylcysteine O-methyltransferase Ste14